MGMRNDSQKTGDRALVTRSVRGNTGLIPHSFKALSRIVSSGASSVVRSAASAASAIVEKDGETNHDQVSWAGFDKLELERGVARQVLLLGFNHGFQVWDVEDAHNVCNLASRQDCPVSFMQIQPMLLTSSETEDKFALGRPLLIICADESASEDNSILEEALVHRNGSIRKHNGSINGSRVPTVVLFYSLKSQTYVHVLRFRSAVHLVRCSCRVVCVLQSAQIHCLNSATLEREYTILTNPVTTRCLGYGNIGLGPLAVGPRWMAYSGSLVVTTNSGRVSPQHLTPSCSYPAASENGSLVAHYAKETSKQLAAGIATLGDMGYKKLSRYYADLLPDGKNVVSGTGLTKTNSVSGGHPADEDNVGMVIVRDIVQKTVVAQFRAHKSPISGLCFDSSGTLLVTTSVQGHNINVFRIMPVQSGDSTGTSSGPSYAHLYRLQRGFTNAVIQDISFSSDSKWIMISSSRGTSHLFAISPSGGEVSFESTDACLNPRVNGTCSMKRPATRRPSNSGLQVLTPQSICKSGSPITLSAISRIRNGSNGWKNTVSGAAAAATGRLTSLSGAIASAFHKCKGNDSQCCDNNSLKKKYYLLVFSPSGCVIQYALHFSSAIDGITTSPGVSIASEQSLSCEGKLMVEAIQKWNICQKQSRRDQGGNMDMYGDNGNSNSKKVYLESMKCENGSVAASFCATTKEKITTEEKLHMCISEAELQMHQNINPLWMRSEIYFQLLLTDGFDGDDEASTGGEIEIEKLPLHTLEARSKELIPVYNYLRTAKFQEGRVSVKTSKQNEQFQPNRLGISGISKLSQESRSSSLNSTATGCLENSSADEEGLDARHFIEGFVNTTNDAPVMETQRECVNSRENSGTDDELGSVHNRHRPDNRSEEGDEFD